MERYISLDSGGRSTVASSVEISLAQQNVGEGALSLARKRSRQLPWYR